MVPRHLHEAHELRHRGPRPIENEPTHGEIFDAIMDIRERLEKIETEIRRTN